MSRPSASRRPSLAMSFSLPAYLYNLHLYQLVCLHCSLSTCLFLSLLPLLPRPLSLANFSTAFYQLVSLSTCLDHIHLYQHFSLSTCLSINFSLRGRRGTWCLSVGPPDVSGRFDAAAALHGARIPLC